MKEVPPKISFDGTFSLFLFLTVEYDSRNNYGNRRKNPPGKAACDENGSGAIGTANDPDRIGKHHLYLLTQLWDCSSQ